MSPASRFSRGDPGVAFNRDGALVRTPPRCPEGPGPLPLPARDLLDAAAYRKAWWSVMDTSP